MHASYILHANEDICTFDLDIKRSENLCDTVNLFGTNDLAANLSGTDPALTRDLEERPLWRLFGAVPILTGSRLKNTAFWFNSLVLSSSSSVKYSQSDTASRVVAFFAWSNDPDFLKGQSSSLHQQTMLSAVSLSCSVSLRRTRKSSGSSSLSTDIYVLSSMPRE